MAPPPRGRGGARGVPPTPEELELMAQRALDRAAGKVPEGTPTPPDPSGAADRAEISSILRRPVPERQLPLPEGPPPAGSQGAPGAQMMTERAVRSMVRGGMIYPELLAVIADAAKKGLISQDQIKRVLAAAETRPTRASEAAAAEPGVEPLPPPTYPPRGRLRVGPYSNATQVPNLGEMPIPEATALARQNVHLIEAPRSSEGAYVGGQRDVKSYADLQRFRRALDALVAADPRGGDWYPRTREGIESVARGDPAGQATQAAIDARVSAGNSPIAEAGQAIKMNNAAVAGRLWKDYDPYGVAPEDRPTLRLGHKPPLGPGGEPLWQPTPEQFGRRANTVAVTKGIEAGIDNPDDPMASARAIPQGKKTGKYRNLIDPTQDIETATGVQDFRDLANKGYRNPEGTIPRSGNHPTGAQVHMFGAGETAAAVGRANEIGLGGRNDWTGDQIQAAPWVVQKTLALMSRNAKLSYEDAFALANQTFANAIPKHAVNEIYELKPGQATGHRSDVFTDPQAAKEYAEDPFSHWMDENHRDILIEAMKRADAPGFGMRQRDTVPSTGMWINKAGGVEINPAKTAGPLVGFKTTPEGGRAIADTDRELVRALTTFRALLGAQEAGGAHINIREGLGRERGSIFVPLDRPLTKPEVVALNRLGAEFNLGDVGDTGRGFTLTNWGGPDAPGRLTGKDLSQAMRGSRAKPGISERIRQIIPDVIPERIKTESIYEELPQEPGSGKATQKVLDMFEQFPAMREHFGKDLPIADRVRGMYERDEAAAAKGAPVRSDIQNLREKVAASPGADENFFDVLREMLKHPGHNLPSFAPLIGAPVAALGLYPKDQQQPAAQEPDRGGI